MESSSSSSEFRSSPTVSKDKWAMHARTKLLKGYVLIIAHGRRTASFFKEGRGFEPCPFKIAKALVEMGLVEEAGPHFLGTKYVLSSAAPEPPRLADADDDDEGDDEGPREQASSGMEGLLDDLEAEQGDDEESDGEEDRDGAGGDDGEEDRDEEEDEEEDY